MANEAPSRIRIGTPNWNILIPGLRDYLVPGPAAPEDYALLESKIEIALGLTELFWPPFVEYEEMAFRGSAEDPVDDEASKNLASWANTFNGSGSEVERMVNHEHLVDLFEQRHGEAEPDPEKLIYLGKVVRDMWAAKLKLDFPNRNFNVDLYVSEQSDIGEWLITFYQQSAA